MYKRVYNFLAKVNIIYDLQFFLRQKFNLTENIRLNLDDGYIGRGIFVHSKKSF